MVVTHHPCSDSTRWLGERPLIDATQLEAICADLRDVVQQCPECSRREDCREEEDIAKLQEHLQVVIEGALKMRQAKCELSSETERFQCFAH